MSVTTQDLQWYYSAGGQSKGPVDSEAFYKVLESGVLDPTMDLAWNETMSDWRLLEQIDELQEPLSRSSKRVQPRPITSPAEPTTVCVAPPPPPAEMLSHREEEDLARAALRKNHFIHGIDRFYFNVSVMLLLGGMVAGAVFLPHSEVMTMFPRTTSMWFLPGIALIGSSLIVFQTLRRFKNLRMSGWWVLVHFLIPIANLWTGFRLFAAPPAYAETKKMDFPGGVLAFLYVVPLSLLAAAGVYFAYLLNSGEISGLPHPDRVNMILDQVRTHLGL